MHSSIDLANGPNRSAIMKLERIPFEELEHYIQQRIVILSNENPSYSAIGVLEDVNIPRNCLYLVPNRLYSEFDAHWTAARIVYS